MGRRAALSLLLIVAGCVPQKDTPPDPPSVVHHAMGAGRTPIVPASWTIPNWYIDPAMSVLVAIPDAGADAGVDGSGMLPCASDQNTCTSAVCGPIGSNIGPCKTWAEIVARYGTISPILAQNTTVTQLSSHTNNSDPVVWHPWRKSGVIAQFVGGPPTVLASGVSLASVTPKNRAAGANSDLRANIGAAGAAAVRIQNTTRANSFSYAFRVVSGNIWELDQPFNPIVVPFAQTHPTENDAWANTDTVTIQQPIQSNIASLDSLSLDIDAAENTGLYVTGLTFYDPSPGGIGFSNVYIGRHVHIGDAVMQRNPAFDLVQDNFIPRQVQGVHILGTPYGHGALPDPVFIGGAFAAGAAIESMVVDGDIILSSFNNFYNNCIYGFVYLDQALQGFGSAIAYLGSFRYNFNEVVYGSANGKITLQGTASLITNNQTFTATFTAPKFIAGTGFVLNGATTASTHSGANPDVITPGVTLSVANLDAAGVPGAFDLGGAAMRKSAQ